MRTLETGSSLPNYLTAGLGGCLFGLFVFALLPTGVIAINDDFGYLRSVVQTVQHGRPWTDDWLEPWSAGFSGLSALCFKVSGSFYFATYGLLGILAGLSFAFGSLLFLSRQLSLRATFLITGLGLTFPTVLWKTVEFTGMTLYLPCLLAALGFAERRRWAGFLIAWLLAISTRQSAIVWAVLPVAAIVEDRFRLRAPLRAALAPGAIVLAGAGFYRWLGLVMNKTHAQRFLTDTMLARWSIGQAGRDVLVGLGLWLVVAGLVGAVFLRSWPIATKPAWPAVALRIAAAALLLSFLRWGAHDVLAFDHAAFDGAFGQVYLFLLLAAAAGGAAFGQWSISWVPAAGALGSLAALTLRDEIWDYYALDVAIFAFFALAPVPADRAWVERDLRARLAYRSRSGPNAVGGQARPEVALHPLTQRAAVLFRSGLAGAFVLAHLCFVAHFKARLDRGYALCNLGSRALAKGIVQPDEPSFMPFGLQGWYYFPTYVTHEGANSGDAGNFGRYLKQDSIDLAWRYSKPLRWLPGHGGGLPDDRRRTILAGRYPYFWFFTQDFLILRAQPDRVRPAKAALPADFRLEAFPQDDAGWARLIRGG